MTIEKMYQEIKANVEAIQEIGWKQRSNEKFAQVLKHYDDLGCFLNRRSMPRKSEVTRIHNMSKVALRRAQSFQ